tara:strand:+ start:938 stop:1072 length:135 start_codon:yes stop_codon:yes gene_type:complete
MRKLTATICLSIAAPLVGAELSVGANFQRGLTAAKNGDYATAFR